MGDHKPQPAVFVTRGRWPGRWPTSDQSLKLGAPCLAFETWEMMKLHWANGSPQVFEILISSLLRAENHNPQPATPKVVGPTAGGAEDYLPKAHTQCSSQNTSTLVEAPFQSTQASQKLYIEKTHIFAHPATITPTESTNRSFTAQPFCGFLQDHLQQNKPLTSKKQLKNTVFRLYNCKTPVIEII